MNRATTHPENDESAPVMSVVVVSYNTRDMTLRCLRTLFETTRELSLEVWVVDNGSKDGSVEAIGREFPDVFVIENPNNAGFGAANNRAMEQARGELFLLLNSDAFVHEGALQKLIEYSKSHPQTGVIGPRLQNEDGTLQRSCYRFPSPAHSWRENLWVASLLPSSSRWSDWKRWPHDEEREVDWVVGACFVVRRAVFADVGGFDERFFMYFEEIDWQRRARDAGWKIAFVPTSVVTHLGGASAANGSSGAVEQARVSESFFQSLDFYAWKHHGMRGLVSLRLAMTIGCSLRAVLWSLATMIPAKRRVARSKSKLQAWLALRQISCWKLPLRDEK